MKKLLAILLAPFCLMAAVSYDTESELQKIYSETQETNKRIESVKEEITETCKILIKINTAINRLNKTMDKICQEVVPFTFQDAPKEADEHEN